jgi:hypothetical protein
MPPGTPADSGSHSTACASPSGRNGWGGGGDQRRVAGSAGVGRFSE